MYARENQTLGKQVKQMSSTREVAVEAVDRWRASWRGASDCCYGANRLGLIDAVDSALRQREKEVRAEERERAAKICEGLVTFDPDHGKYAPEDADAPCGWCDGLEKAAATIRRDSEAQKGERPS